MASNILCWLIKQLHKLEPTTMPAPLDELNDAVTNLNSKNNDLITARQNIGSAVDGVIARVSSIPAGPDLAPVTAAINLAANSLVETKQVLDDNTNRLNAVLPG